MCTDCGSFWEILGRFTRRPLGLGIGPAISPETPQTLNPFSRPRRRAFGAVGDSVCVPPCMCVLSSNFSVLFCSVPVRVHWLGLRIKTSHRNPAIGTDCMHSLLVVLPALRLVSATFVQGGHHWLRAAAEPHPVRTASGAALMKSFFEREPESIVQGGGNPTWSVHSAAEWRQMRDPAVTDQFSGRVASRVITRSCTRSGKRRPGRRKPATRCS